jgi:hypothetical protein
MYKHAVAVGNACSINDEKPASFVGGSNDFLAKPRDSVCITRGRDRVIDWFFELHEMAPTH